MYAGAVCVLACISTYLVMAGDVEWQKRLNATQEGMSAGKVAGVEAELVSLVREAAHPEHRVLAFGTLGQYYAQMGEIEKAEQSYQRGRYWLERSSHKNDPAARLMLSAHLSNLYVANGQQGKADREARELRRWLEAADGLSPALQAKVLLALGAVRFSGGRLDTARPLYERVLSILNTTVLRSGFLAERSKAELGALHLMQGRLSEAETLLLECLADLEERGLVASLDAAIPTMNLGHLYALRGRSVEAERAYGRAVSIAESKLDGTDPLLARMLLEYSAFSSRNGKSAEARKLGSYWGHGPSGRPAES